MRTPVGICLYPAEAKRAFDRLVTNLAHALSGGVDAYCEDATVAR